MTGRTTKEILKSAGGYEGIVKSMAKDQSRTKRQREVEACFSGDLPSILARILEDEGSKSGALRKINETLRSNNFDDTLSRPTLYAWLDEYEREVKAYRKD